jgi:hypothetical protein
MYSEFDKIEKAKVVLQKIANGINPITGEIFEKDNFLNNPKIIRCFYFVSEILDNVLNGKYRDLNLTTFYITPEDKNKVKFPQENIGVNQFSNCINASIDLSRSKKLTGVELNKRLKKMGILSEIKTAEGKTRTTVNQNSSKYGFETEVRIYNGVESERVFINDFGKKYLLENIEKIMSIDV